jgi:DNA polymerase III delta subunit
VSGDVPVLAYYRGDDGYLIDRAVAAVGERLDRGTGMRPERWRAAGAETNAAAITERVATAPMFGGGTLAVVEDPAPLLRSKDAREALEGAIRSVAPGNALVFVEQGDAGNRRSAAVQGLEASVQRAGGEARLFKAPTADALAGWITARSTERGLRLGPGAAKELARRVGGFVREGDVDRQRQGALAVAELAKLALYRPDGAIAQEDVQALVPEVVPDSTWAFLDAVAERRAGTAARLLDHLLESTPEPVILVQLHRRLRELLEVADQLASGVAPAALVRSLKMNPHRVEVLARQARAWTSAALEDALEGVLELDAMVKGAPDAFGTDSQRRLAFALWVQERVASSAAGSVAAPRRG